MNSRQKRLIERGFIPVRQAAAFLGISKQSVYHLIDGGTLSHAVFAGLKVVPVQALHDYAAARIQIGKIA